MSKLAILNINGDILPKAESGFVPEDGTKTFGYQDMIDFIEANKDATDIQIDIRSNGGSVDEAFDIYQQIKQLIYNGKKVVIHGYKVASAATIIFMAVPKKNRLLASYAPFLPHFPTIELQGRYNASQAENIAEFIRNYQTKIENFYIEDFNISENNTKIEALKKMMDKDIPISAEEAIKWGFAGGLIDASHIKDNVVPKMGKVYAYSKEMVSILNKKNTKKGTMAKTIKEIYDMLMKQTKPVVKAEDKTVITAASSTLEDGTTKIYYDGSLAVDTAVFSDEAMTMPQDDGDVILDDGRVVTIAAGVVSAISDAPVAVDTAKEIANLKTQLAAKEKELSDKAIVEAAKDATAKEIAEGVQALLKMVPGANNGEFIMASADIEKLSQAQQHRHFRNLQAKAFAKN